MKNLFSPNKYDAWYETPLGSLCDRLEKDAIFSLFKPKGFVLDMGCGTGNYTFEIEKRGGKAIGIDVSIDMILSAKNKAAAKGMKSFFVVGNAEKMPFKNNSFDGVLEVAVLCFTNHIDKVIRETYRILKPEGMIAIGELNRFSYWAFLRRLKSLFKKSIYKNARFYSIKALCKILGNAEFKDLRWSSCLHFPPINSKWFLKGCKFFENISKLLFPKNGAFFVISGRK
ncbi:MAG: class I SAM-dependent methyltransferase [Deltaproteobacteria bacterium]|nr:class I SAM-dependent methyltransferase [Deltaproteobacteria bacterium]